MRRRAFTLVELLVAIAIIGILAALFLAALGESAKRAQASRTQALIKKLDRAIETRWESYRTRRVSISPADYLATLGMPVTPQNVAFVRLAAIREMQRFELPQRYADIIDTPAIIPRPAVSQAYYRQWVAAGSPTGGDYQAAECLYLIVTSGGIEDDPLGEDHFRHEDVGDVDGNGLNEFIDGYGNPIRFLRWPVAFLSDRQPDPTVPDVETFSRDNHDPLDQARLDVPGGAWTSTGTPTGYRLFPLIYSAGPDGIYDIDVGAGSATFATAADYMLIYQSTIGQPIDSDNISYTATGPADGEVGAFDNIHNHTQDVR